MGTVTAARWSARFVSGLPGWWSGKEKKTSPVRRRAATPRRRWRSSARRRSGRRRGAGGRGGRMRRGDRRADGLGADRLRVAALAVLRVGEVVAEGREAASASASAIALRVAWRMVVLAPWPRTSRWLAPSGRTSSAETSPFSGVATNFSSSSTITRPPPRPPASRTSLDRQAHPVERLGARRSRTARRTRPGAGR